MKKFVLAMLAMVFCMTSCSDNDNEVVNAAQEVAARYEGYINASCAYFSDKVTDDQTLTITSKTVSTVDVNYTSDTWGTFTISDATVVQSGNAYQITGSGSTLMGHAGSEDKEYACSLSGTVADGKAELTFTCPSVMGGLNIVFKSGVAPATEN
jgi:hypothetical protein